MFHARLLPSCLATVLLAGIVSTPAQAASHREAPLIAQQPAADITDVYAFRSWKNPANAVFIMNVIPSQEPSAAPNYFFFDPGLVYEFHLDTNQDGMADDIVYQVRFATELRSPFDDLPLSFAGVDTVPGLPPAIRHLDGPGSEGLGLRQSYTVTRIANGVASEVGHGFAVPSNTGPRTMPDYEALAAEGIVPLAGGGMAFAGQREETFYIDLGATFDTLNFRQAPILSPDQDAERTRNPFGNDMFSGFNVSSIALEVPIGQLGGDPKAVVGFYASTSRVAANGDLRPLARMGNPLINELVIGTGMKDVWNMTDPSKEAKFLDFYLNPRLAGLLNLAFGTNFQTTNRTDLVQALLRYPGQKPGACTKANPCSELLRLNLGAMPTPPGKQQRLGGLAGDGAGFPNGRRPNDDVTDIALRVVAGALLGPVPALGDGVNFNIGAKGSHLTANGIYTEFPYLPTPYDGRDRRHIDCGEAKANPC